MSKPKLIRITTVPLSLDKLLEGQLRYMSEFYEVIAMSSDREGLRLVGDRESVNYHAIPLTRQITPLKDLFALWKLYQFLRKEKPQIVHTHTPKAGLIGMLAAWMAQVPVRMHTVAGLPLMEATGVKRRLLTFLEKLTYRLTSKVYPNSQGLASFILTQKLTTSNKLKIIGKGSSNGIDLHYFNPSVFSREEITKQKESLAIPERDLVFSFVGRLVKDKGIQELVTAFDELSKDFSKIHLLLIGSYEPTLDPLNEEAMERIEKNPKIHAIGYQKDIRPYLGLSNIFVFPSYREGFPNAVMQALAMEVPVIASDINGCNELIVHGENGWLVPAKDAVALEQQIRSILEQPNVLQTMKKGTRSSIEKNFQRENIWQLLHQEYEELIRRNY